MKSKLLFLLALFLWAGSSWGVTVTIGTGTSTQRQPFGMYYGYERSASIYTYAEMTTYGTITTISWYVGTAYSTNCPTKIYLKTTTAATLTADTWANMISGATTVYNATRNFTPTGWLTIDITDFDYLSDNLLVLCETNYTGGGTGSYPNFRYTASTSKHEYWATDNTPPSSNGTVNSSRPNIQFNITTTLPTLTVIPASLSFGYVANGSYGNSQYVLSGTNLTAGPIVVTAPAGFGVSLSNGGPYTSSVDVSYTPPVLGNTDIFVQFAPTGSPAAYSGNITNIGGGSNANVAVSGSSYLYSRYCASNATSPDDEDILNVTLGTLNNTSDCGTAAPGPGSVINQYSNYTTTVAAPDLAQGASIPFSVQVGTCGGSYSNQTRIYIDFNQDGDFLDTGETVFTGISVAGPHTETGNIAVPGGATLGNTMMRVVTVESAAPASCGTYSWGETEDYLVNIILPPNYQLTWYNLQWPATANINQTQNVSVFAQCWESGVTEAAGPGVDISCWIGYNTTDTDPSTWTNWVSASYNYGIDPNNNDEYMADLGALQSLAPGTYYYASRFQYKGGIMTYGGYNSGGGGPWDGASNVSGVLTVTPYIAPLPYSQNFPTSSFAPYWTQTYADGVTSNVWIVSNSFAAGGGAYEMKASYVNQIGLTRLISPALDFSTAADPWLSFKTFYDDFGTGVTLKIQTSTDLVNWTDAWSYTGGSGNINTSTINVDLPNTGTAPTYVAWVIDGNHYQFDYWHVDDVLVQDGVPAIPGYWLGNLSDDWFTPGNWADGVVPTSLTNVTIPAGRPNYPYLNLTPLAECNKLTILNGGAFRIDSFFDVFTEISVDGGLTIEPNATVNVSTNIQQAGNGVITINGGNLNVNGNWGGPLFGGAWAGGVLNLNGGTVDLEGAALLGTTAVNMNGPFQFYVRGNAFRMDGDFQSTPTGGTFYFEPASGITDVYIFNSDDSGVMSFFDIFLECGSSNVWLNPTWGSTSLWVRNFTVNGGNVSTISSDDLLEMSEFVIAGDMNLAADNNVNFITQTTPVTVAGEINQGLISGSGYASIMSNGNITGDYNLNIDINPLTSPGRWILISPPVAGLTADVFHCQFLQRHDPITNTWIDCIPTDPLIPGIDYALWVHPDPINIPGDPICGPVIAPLTSFSWSGIMNSGAVTSPLFCDDPVNEGWNNVGNPYQATIDWDATGWTKTNVNNAIYLENNGLWASYINGSGTNGGTRYIAPGQGFFVQCNDIAGGSLTFDPSIRTLQRTAFFKNSVPDLVKLEASGNGRTDETVVRFVEESTPGFDSEWDARKFHSSVNGYPEIPQLYSMDNGHMSINTLPATESVALGFKAGIENTYTIKALEINNLTKVDLEDRSTGIITNLLTDAYSFNYKPGENEQRFILHFAPLSINEAGQNVANIYSQDHTVYVDLIEYNQGNIFIYNVSGQLVANESATMGMNTLFLRNSGHYIVKVVTDEETLVKKVFIHQ